MGYIKGRFCSLRGLRQQVDNSTDHARAVAWIKTCIVLHTLIFIIENGNEDPDYVEELLEEGLEQETMVENDLAAEAVRETRGQQMRNDLKAKLFEYFADIDDEY